MTYQAPLSMGFSRQECWSGLPFASLEDLPNQGTKPGSPALQAGALPSEPPGKAPGGSCGQITLIEKKMKHFLVLLAVPTFC